MSNLSNSELRMVSRMPSEKGAILSAPENYSVYFRTADQKLHSGNFNIKKTLCYLDDQ